MAARITNCAIALIARRGRHLDPASVCRFLNRVSGSGVYSAASRPSINYGSPATARCEVAPRDVHGESSHTIAPNPERRIDCSSMIHKYRNWRPVGDSNPCYRRERAVS